MPGPLRVLMVEDSSDDAFLLERELRQGGFLPEVVRVETAEQMARALDERSWDLVLSDHAVPGFGAFPALELVRERGLDVPFIIVSGTIGEQTAVEALKAGAHDYLMKDAVTRLVPAIERELRDATLRHERRRADRDLRESETRLRAVMHGVVDAILTLDEGGLVTTVNPAAERMLALPARELVGGPFASLLIEPHAGEYAGEIAAHARGESIRLLDETRQVVARRPDGSMFPLEVALSTLEIGERPGLIVVARDITERKRSEEQLQYLADHDGLTGLFNRRRFEEELAREVAFASRYGTGGAALVLDVDNFKDVNDTLGHAHGDELIRGVARLLCERIRDTDIVARLGGDEFAILLPRTGADHARQVAEDLLAAVRRQSVVIGGKRVRMTTSIGIASFDDRDSGSELLVAADVALYEAKEAGRDRLATYTASRGEHARMEARVTWSDRIRRALANGLLMPWCQPILDLSSNTVSQFELLVRMVGEDGRPVLPDAFLPTAERAGMIGEIDRFMVLRAIALLAAQQKTGRELRLEVNLSGKSIGDPALTQLIQEQLEWSGIDPSRLIFEITETAAITNMDDAQRFANTLRPLGCGFALDDFGAGFGSYYYLKHLPLDYLKIDGDFIRDLPRNRTDQLVVKSIVEMARGLGLKTIAEFVGDEQTLAMLQRNGVDFAQGYHIGRPAPAADAWERNGWRASG